MKRRDFLKNGSAVAAGAVVAGTAGVAAASQEVKGAGGFRLLSSDERYCIPTGDPNTFACLHEYVVECPYPVGTDAWLAIADRDEAGHVVVRAEDRVVPFATKVRRCIFPRFQLEGDDTIMRRAVEVYRKGTTHGFDTAKGPEHDWKVVHVEYRCPDGVEHTMAAFPVEWDSRLALSVFNQQQIA